MRRIAFTTAHPVEHSERVFFPLPFGTSAQQVQAAPDLPRLKADNAGQQVLVIDAAAGTRPGVTITFADGFSPIPDWVWVPSGGMQATPSPGLSADMARIAPPGSGRAGLRRADHGACGAAVCR